MPSLRCGLSLSLPGLTNEARLALLTDQNHLSLLHYKNDSVPGFLFLLGFLCLLFKCGHHGLKSGLYACEVNTLPTELSLWP